MLWYSVPRSDALPTDVIRSGAGPKLTRFELCILTSFCSCIAAATAPPGRLVLAACWCLRPRLAIQPLWVSEVRATNESFFL